MSESPASPQMPAWTEPLIKALELTHHQSAEEVLQRAELAANRLAPDTRRIWKWILAMEGFAVLAPIAWLLVVRLGLPISYAAYSVIVCTVLVVGICWWLRWRGMQQTWARARMMAEIARSAMSTTGLAGDVTVDALGGAPALQPIAKWILGDHPLPEISPDEAKARYLTTRINDQLNYYRRKHDEAIRDRRRLSGYVTLSLDGALFLAVAGVALSLSHTAERWLRLSGSDYILGVVGSSLPLVAILMQLLGSYLELNRRAGRYAQQAEFLDSVKKRFEDPMTADQLRTAMQEVERVLLSEVVEWFYQAQHSEPYYRSKNNALEASEIRDVLAAGPRSWKQKLMVWFGISAGFIGRVVFGRVLVVALSVVVTTAFIAFCIPKDSAELSKLRLEDGRLLSSPGADGWQPVPEQAEKGFILIAHGLHDGVDTSGKLGTKPHWMTRMEDTLRQHLGPNTPDICLVDWHLAAIPAVFSGFGFEPDRASAGQDHLIPSRPQAWLQDVAAIRPQAEEIGELVGFKLARALRAGILKQDQPMHLIGHSAGGFVVLQAALVLRQLGLAPKDLRITMLDTPMPVMLEQLKLLSDDVPVDFYCTSAFTTGIPESGFGRYFTKFNITPPAGTDPYTGAHSFAHQWYIDSITAGSKIGFGLSPFSVKR
ncbi:MAG: hypothetical protein ABIS50_17365 [Luteolibacter sp.]|uniref:hypothetical protein n=1 Tax=Luteolibacter sp. TaxID=1962973 RepID=UPI0032644995